MRTDAINSPAQTALTRLFPTALGTRALELAVLYAKLCAFHQEPVGFFNQRLVFSFFLVLGTKILIMCRVWFSHANKKPLKWTFPKTASIDSHELVKTLC
jgi:hypothetical protein